MATATSPVSPQPAAASGDQRTAPGGGAGGGLCSRHVVRGLVIFSYLEKMIDMISIFLNLLRLVLYLLIWSIFENVQYSFENNVCCAFWG